MRDSVPVPCQKHPCIMNGHPRKNLSDGNLAQPVISLVQTLQRIQALMINQDKPASSRGASMSCGMHNHPFKIRLKWPLAVQPVNRAHEPEKDVLDNIFRLEQIKSGASRHPDQSCPAPAVCASNGIHPAMQGRFVVIFRFHEGIIVSASVILKTARMNILYGIIPIFFFLKTSRA